MVRIIGATKTRLPERVYCRFWYPPEVQQMQQLQQAITVPAKVSLHIPDWNIPLGYFEAAKP